MAVPNDRPYDHHLHPANASIGSDANGALMCLDSLDA